LVFTTSAFARDAVLDALVIQGKVTEEDVAAAEMEGPNNVMTKTAYDVYIGGYVQSTLTWVDNGDPETAFALRRARLKIRGMLGDAWGFVLQTELADGASLRDVGVWYDTGYGKVKLGQWKTPFILENITSSGKLDTINRAAITGEVDDRDIGLFWGHEFLEGKLGLQAAATNGTGTNGTENNDEKDLYVRVSGKPFQGSENPADGLLLAAAYNVGEQASFDATTGADLGDFDRDRWVGTVQWLWNQIKVQGEYVNIEEDLAIGGKMETKGWYFLASYDMAVDSMSVIPIVKYEDLDSDVLGEGGSWLTLGVAFGIVGRHDVKVEINYVIEDLDSGTDVDELTLQVTANY
jgi:hypothetical protein